MDTILIVDDEKNYLVVLETLLGPEGYEIITSENARDALHSVREGDLDLIITDMKMPGMNGMELLEECKRIKPDLPIIIMTAYGSIEMAVEAMKKQAYDYITKPFQNEELKLTIKKALENYRLVKENRLLSEALSDRFKYGNIIGKSKPMLEVYDIIEKVAQSKTSVLITGPSGTGKELIARAIHKHSLRAKERFVQVNCAAIPEELIESELFGHVKGAFTGATEKKAGKFEQADGGTIFLDEIGDMSLKTQSKVLRVLEEGEIQKVGSSKINKVDVRVIAATNKDLKKEKKEGRFREDLFFRLNVIPLYSPPLREKKEDIPLLVEYFSKIYSEENNFKQKEFSKDTIEAIKKYTWIGNVRELKNVVERLLIMTETDIIEMKDLPEQIRGEVQTYLPDASGIKTLKEFREQAEKDFILSKLKQNNWNISQTAREIDTPRSNLYKKLEHYGIKIEAGVGEAVAPSSQEK